MFRLAAHSLLAFVASFTAAAAAPVTFTSAGSTFQSFTAPTAGTYDIVAFGAQGGAGSRNSDVAALGGLGAEIGADFVLTAGETLSIAVGVMGINPGGFGGGGGGGSFVVGPAGAPLVIAGGGGGGGGVGFTLGDGGQIGTTGSGIGGGTAGGGGGGATLQGGGGGGFKGDGTHASGKYPAGGGGAGYPSLLGGFADYLIPSGGFGGGGGGFSFGGGGGGGYSGGAGGGFGTGFAAGGGGSFDSGTNQVLVAGFNSGDGSVVITELSATPVPEPASLALLGVGLIGLLSVPGRRAG